MFEKNKASTFNKVVIFNYVKNSDRTLYQEGSFSQLYFFYSQYTSTKGAQQKKHI